MPNPEFPRAPKDACENEAASGHGQSLCYGDHEKWVCNRIRGHAGDHVSAFSDTVLARWPQSPAPSAPFDYAAAWMSVRGALHDGRDKESEEFPDWDDLNTSERAAFARWVDELRGK